MEHSSQTRIYHNYGAGFGYAALAAGAGFAVAREGPEGLSYMAGGMVGGMAGYQAGAAITSTQQWQNWQGGHEFKSDQTVTNKLLDEGRIQEAWDYTRERAGIPAWDAEYRPDLFENYSYEDKHHLAYTMPKSGKTFFRNSIYYKEPTALKMVVAHEYQHHLQATGNMYKTTTFGESQHYTTNTSALEVAADKAVLQNAGRLGLTHKVRQDVINHMKRYSE